MPTGQPALSLPLSMDLTVPAEPRFVAIAVAMTRMVAEQLGFPAESARRLAADLERQTARIDSAGDPVVIRYEASQSGLKVHVRAGQRSFDLAPL